MSEREEESSALNLSFRRQWPKESLSALVLFFKPEKMWETELRGVASASAF